MRSLKKSMLCSLACLLSLAVPVQAVADNGADNSADTSTSDSASADNSAGQGAGHGEDNDSFAQTEDVSGLIQLGSVAFTEQRYSDAAVYFEKAFSLNPNKLLLKNAMVGWYKAKNCKEAARVASRLVAFVGAKDLSGKIDSEVTTVVNCALDDVEEQIADKNYNEAKALLSTAASCVPSDEQTSRIDQYWKDITEAENKVFPVIPPPEPKNKTSLSGAAPWIALTCGVAGSALLAPGVYYLTSNEPKVAIGATLSALGSISLMGGVAALLIWLKPSADVEDNVAVYYNKSYSSDGGIRSVVVSPLISPDSAAASLSLTF